MTLSCILTSRHQHVLETPKATTLLTYNAFFMFLLTAKIKHGWCMPCNMWRITKGPKNKETYGTSTAPKPHLPFPSGMSSHPRGYELFTSGHPPAPPPGPQPAQTTTNTHALARHSHTPQSGPTEKERKILRTTEEKKTENSGWRGWVEKNQETNYDFRWPTGQTL